MSAAADRIRKALDDADVNRFGSAWYTLIRRQDVERVLDVVARVERLGHGAACQPGNPGPCLRCAILGQ